MQVDRHLHKRKALVGHVAHPLQGHEDRKDNGVASEKEQDTLQEIPEAIRQSRLHRREKGPAVLRRRLLARLSVRQEEKAAKKVLARKDRA